MSMTQPGHMQAPSLMMTTSGLKSLDEIHEEQQINEDLRWGILGASCMHVQKCAPNVICCGLCGCAASVQAVKQQVSAVLSITILLHPSSAVFCSKALSCELSIPSCTQHCVAGLSL